MHGSISRGCRGWSPADGSRALSRHARRSRREACRGHLDKEKLTRTISTDGLGENALAALSIFRDRLARGEGITEAALGTAGYSPPDVEAAIAKQGRHEMRAFEALLARSSWRQRLVLWLLGATNKR
jgi:hypothetical protein